MANFLSFWSIVRKGEKRVNFVAFWPTVRRKSGSRGEDAVGQRRRWLGGDGGAPYGGGSFIGEDI